MVAPSYPQAQIILEQKELTGEWGAEVDFAQILLLQNVWTLPVKRQGPFYVVEVEAQPGTVENGAIRHPNFRGNINCSYGTLHLEISSVGRATDAQPSS